MEPEYVKGLVTGHGTACLSACGLGSTPSLPSGAVGSFAAMGALQGKEVHQEGRVHQECTRSHSFIFGEVQGL